MYIIIGVGLLLGCGERKEYVDVLQRAIATADEHPDSALVMLDSLARHEVDFGKHFLMQYRLHRLNVYNKLDTVFKTTEEAQHLADYFEDNGTSNEKMLAYYLLGRTYYDTHEAPMALKYFRTAAEKADTTAADCNYRQLSRVYGQMGNLFYYHDLMQNSINSTRVALDYARMAHDTINYIREMAAIVPCYLRSSKLDSALYYCIKASDFSKKNGYNNLSAAILGGVIRELVEVDSINKAKSFIDRYESESGFFDGNHRIEKGREVYYYSKGLYYLGIEKYDSAEYYFRLELENGKDFNNQNAASRGLALLYKKIHKPDSSAKYALYSYAMNDSVYAQKATDEVERMHSMYDYTRNQEQAQQERDRAENEEKKSNAILMVFLLFVVAAAIIANIVYKRRKDEKRKYLESISALAKTQAEILLLRSHKMEYESEIRRLIDSKENEVAQLNSNIEEYKEKAVAQKESAESLLQKSELYIDLQKKAGKAELLTDDDWHQIYVTVIEIFPAFYQFISSKRFELNEKEFKTCILIRLHFTPKEISNMLGVSSAYITKMRNQMMLKLFGVEGKSKELDEKLLDYS